MCAPGFLKNLLFRTVSQFSEKRECVMNNALFMSSMLLSDS